jgi:hypothetical protein
MPTIKGKKFPYTKAGKAAAKKAVGMNDGGAAPNKESLLYKGAQKALKEAMKDLRMVSGAAISEDEIDAVKTRVARKMLRAESGAAINPGEMKAFKKAAGFRRGGAATKNKRAPSGSNCGLYGRVQGKMGGGAMKPIGMKGGGMPNIGNNLRRP